MLILDLNADFNVRLLPDTALELGYARLHVLLRAQKLLHLRQVAVDGEVLPRQLLDDLILTLDVLAQAVVFLFHRGLLLENLDQFVFNDVLLLQHLGVRLADLGLHLLVVLAAELQLLPQLEDVA